MTDPASPEPQIPDPETRPRSRRSVRGQLALFAVALVLPVLLFCGYVLASYATTERARIEADAADVANTIAQALDRELTGIFASLEILATSPALDAGDLASFAQQARAVRERQGLVTVLVDPDGLQVVNSRLPDGAPLPRSGLVFDRALLEAGRPFVTDLVIGQVTGNRQLLAAMGVRPRGGRSYVLFFSVELARLQRLIAEADVPPTYTVAMVDRANVIAARSSRAEDFVGKTATRDFVEVATGRSGTWSGTTADGVAVFGTYARSRLSGYRVAVGIRYPDLNAPLWRSLSLFAALFSVVAGLSVLLAVLFGRRITSPISRLSRQAARLGQGALVEPTSTGLRETDAVDTALAASSTRLTERESDLREANAENGRFAYLVSHDLRSPLVNIMGFTTELETLRGDIFGRLARLRAGEDAGDAALAQDFDEAIGFIKTSIGKMDRLINAILGLSRQDRRTFVPVRVDMGELLATVKAGLTVQAERADATVTIAPLPDLFSDRLALEVIFTNLVDNALKYLRRGVPGRVEIDGRQEGRTVVVTVRDNGRGIDPKDAERVFDLFRRSGAQDRPGEGIGLAHVRALVRRLGGTVTLTSEPGQGSTFTVALPRRWTGESSRKAA